MAPRARHGPLLRATRWTTSPPRAGRRSPGRRADTGGPCSAHDFRGLEWRGGLQTCHVSAWRHPLPAALPACARVALTVADELTVLPEPRDTGVEFVQARESTARPLRPAVTSGLAHSEMVAAIKEAGDAFRTKAPQVILGHWAADYQRRLDRREAEVADLEDQVASLREERAALRTELHSLKQTNLGGSLLQILGGAVLGTGLAGVSTVSAWQDAGPAIGLILLGSVLASAGVAASWAWKRGSD